MKSSETLNVYFYALYDAAAQRAYSGLTAGVCSEDVRNDIAGNYIRPRYVTIRRVPELVGLTNGSHVTITQRPCVEGFPLISCETCRLFGNCGREQTDGLECCPSWRRKN